jgi:NAD(P)-dependent dehydrogenase (short-subunit alcohol dehydrogenase family)
VDELSGRVAVITGGGRGIGRAISLRLAGAGAAVAIGYRRDEAAARGTCAEIVASGGQATAYRASVEEPEQVRAMTEQVLSDFGGVDIAVCNAGIASRGRTLADTESAEWSVCCGRTFSVPTSCAACWCRRCASARAATSSWSPAPLPSGPRPAAART